MKRIFFWLALASVVFIPSQGIWAQELSGGSFSAPVNRIASGTTNTLSAITAPFTTELWVSASAGAKTDTVPGCVSGFNGDYLAEVDGEGNAAADPITVTAASGTIGPAGTPAPGASYSIFANGGVALFQCDGAATHWALVSATASAGRVNYQTGTSYTVAATDNGGVVDLSNAAAIAVTLPQAGTTGFPEGGFSTLLRASGAGAVTVTPTTSTINGAASATIASGNALLVFADGAGNYEGVPIQGALPATVTAGSCTSCNITFTAQGIATAYANGSGGGQSVTSLPADSTTFGQGRGTLLMPSLNFSGGTGLSLSTGTIYYLVFYNPVARPITTATLQVDAAYTGGTSDVYVWLYSLGSTGLPNTLIADFGQACTTPPCSNTSLAATGAIQTAAHAAVNLTASTYYIVAVEITFSGGSGSPTLDSADQSGIDAIFGSYNGVVPVSMLDVAGTYTSGPATAPAPTGSTGANSNAPLAVWVK